MKMLIIGGGHVGRVVTERLSDLPVSVWFADPDPMVIARANGDGIVADETNITDGSELRDQSVADASVVVVATDSDSTNLLIAQLLRVSFDSPRIVVRVNDPQNQCAFIDIDVETVCLAGMLAATLREQLTMPRVEWTISKHMTEQR
jgi:trk system potassium uptake protein TrkA